MSDDADINAAVRIMRQVFAFVTEGEEDRCWSDDLSEKFSFAISRIDPLLKDILRETGVTDHSDEEVTRISELRSLIVKLVWRIPGGGLRNQPLETFRKHGNFPMEAYTRTPEAELMIRAVKTAITLFGEIHEMTEEGSKEFFRYIWDNRDVLDEIKTGTSVIIDSRFSARDFTDVIELSLLVLLHTEAHYPDPDKPPDAFHITPVTIESKLVEIAGPVWESASFGLKITRSNNRGSFHAFCMVIGEKFAFDLDGNKIDNAIASYQRMQKRESQIPDHLSKLLPHGRVILDRFTS